MTRKLLSGLMVIVGVSILLSANGYSCDVSTIEKPEFWQELDLGLLLGWLALGVGPR